MKIITENLILHYIGLLSFIYVLGKVGFKLYSEYKLHCTGPALDYTKFGKWALVTGSTDGIGKGIARELAKLGINIVLVSRNPEKLKRVAEEIENDFHVEVKRVTFDFTQDNNVIASGGEATSTYDVITEATKDLEIGILVNNVGMTTMPLDLFLDCFDSSKNRENLTTGIRRLINCNILSMFKMTQLVLPQMVQRKKGLVINISSMSASLVCPFMALYAASKRSADTYTRALCYEYEDKCIIVQSVQPGLVVTNMTSDTSSTSFFSPSCDTYVSSLMKRIGKQRMEFGYWTHTLREMMLNSIPSQRLYLILKKQRKKDLKKIMMNKTRTID